MVVVILLFIKKQNKKLMKFSVLLPTFNGAKYLKTFIHSIFDQKYFKSLKWNIWNVDSINSFNKILTNDNIGIILLKNNKFSNNLN